MAATTETFRYIENYWEATTVDSNLTQAEIDTRYPSGYSGNALTLNADGTVGVGPADAPYQVWPVGTRIMRQLTIIGAATGNYQYVLPGGWDPRLVQDMTPPV